LKLEVGGGKGKRFVGAVEKVRKWVSMGRGVITVDSAAEESVCPVEWCKAMGTRPVGVGKQMNLINASGGRIEHYGERDVRFKAAGDEGGQKVLGLGFQVAGVQKALAAVWRICDKGNIMQFGPEEGDNYIKNRRSGEKVMLERRGGSYVLMVEFIKEVEEGGEEVSVFRGQGI
jgi:hypothetical protein